MSKLVREHITLNEKFTEDTSDPISDMGIGGYSFDTLRTGAIIRPKMNLSISHGNTGHFVYWGKGINVVQGEALIVTNVRNYVIKGSKEIKICKMGRGISEDEVEATRQAIKVDPNYDRYGTRTRLIITKTQFNNKFEVTEKGF